MTIGIIGGGAAGMMAAATILETGETADVILFEKNPKLGHKVIISGGGRCNVTTGLHSVRDVLQNYPRGSRFLNSAIHQFSPADVFQWFENRGVPLKIEADNRVFPVSNDGHDIVSVFEQLFQSPHCRLRLGSAVSTIAKDRDRFIITTTSGSTVTVDAVIITTGGVARKYTGSTGDGYAFAETFGHAITPRSPSLNAFITAQAWPGQYAGISFPAIQLSRVDNPSVSVVGPIVFTHRGLSGPGVFRLSAHVAHEHYTSAKPLLIELDFIPDQSAAAVRASIDQQVSDHPRQSFKSVLQTWLPKRMTDTVLAELGIASDQTNATMSNSLRSATVTWLKHCPLTVIGRAAGDEFVTAGGVSLAEVNPSTMESRLCPGLYFAGEVLDIDGYTGGFNLQASWATGRLAGLSAATC